MSKKKNKQKEPDKPVLKQEIPIQDDPYWKVSNLHLDMHRLGRSLKQFEHFEEEYPEWTEPLLEGMPTWYCVLGVQKEASEEEIEEAYSNKSQFSYFSGHYIEEAYDVLTDKYLQKKYDELLFIFEQYTKSMLASEKKELIENHNNNLKCEKEFIRMGKIRAEYSGFMKMHYLGASDLYEITGLGQEATTDEIKRKCENGSELYKKIGTILGDPIKRQDYDFMMDFVRKYGRKQDHEDRKRRTKKWEKIDRKTFEKIILFSLDNSDAAAGSYENVNKIISANQDWMNYLPPNKDTFFSILGIDQSSLSGNKKEIENTLREKYRYLEKTPLVNLAYSVLKNESQRADYIWLFDNIHIFNALKFIASDEEDKEEKEKRGVFAKPNKGKGRKKKSMKKSPPQITFEDLERAFERIKEAMRS